jgi:rhodanese-related sulfurtransferase
LFICNCGENQQEVSSKNAKIGEERSAVAHGIGVADSLPFLTILGENHLDIGAVREGSEPHVFFTLVNTGTGMATVAVDDLSKGGCTAVSLIPRLASGDSAELEFIFETLGYGGRSETRKIQITYNNPAHSPLEFSVSATVLAPEPHQAPIGELWYNFYVLVDVRTAAEFAQEHVVGSINVPFADLGKWAASIPQHLLIYLISEDGAQSDRAAKMLREKGFSECLSLIGGLDEWKKEDSKKQLLISDGN